MQAKKHIIHEFLRYYLTWANINCLYYWMPGKVYRTIHTFLLFTKDCMFSMVLFVMYACVCVFSCFGCSKCCLCWSKNKAPGEEPPSTCYVWRTIVPWCCLGKAKVKPRELQACSATFAFFFEACRRASQDWSEEVTPGTVWVNTGSARQARCHVKKEPSRKHAKRSL
jgi:hypothetical protein